MLAGKLLLEVRQTAEAKARALNILAIEPKNVEGLLLFGNALAGVQDLNGAIERVEQALEQDPHSTLAYANLGVFQLAKGDRVAAEAAMKRAVEVQPNSVDAHQALANFYWALGQRADAEQELKTALTLEPSSASVNRALATFYLAEGDRAQAEKHLKAYVNAEPTSSNKLVLVDFYLEQQKASDALPVLQALDKEGDLSAGAASRTD